MELEKIQLNWEEILSGGLTGMLRQTESMRQNISWGHNANFNLYDKWGMTISGSLCEMALAKKMSSYFGHTVNNFHGSDLIIDNKCVQVRSQLMTKKTNNLIIRQGYKKTDYYFLVGDDTPTYRFFGYIPPLDIENHGQWTNFNKTDRPYVWSVPIDKLKPLKQFKYEKHTYK